VIDLALEREANVATPDWAPGAGKRSRNPDAREPGKPMLAALGASGHTYTFTRRPDGLTDIDVVVIREGKNLKGRFLGLVLDTVGKGVLAKAFENSIKAMEAQQSNARGPA
jgi:hypothetical protein